VVALPGQRRGQQQRGHPGGFHAAMVAKQNYSNQR
jgi:hypothetical protein